MTQMHHLRTEPIALDVDGHHGIAYGAERRRLMGHRLPITAVLYLALVGTATGVDLVFHPERLAVALSPRDRADVGTNLSVAAFPPQRAAWSMDFRRSWKPRVLGVSLREAFL
jgi:hypothetical protein